MAAESKSFQKSQRLNSPSEFSNVFNKSERSVDSRFLILATANSLNYSRLGLVVSKHKLRKAVTRNMFKRLVRESFRKNQQILCGLDLVVLPQKHTGEINRELLWQSLETHWRRVTRCKESSYT